MDFAAEFIYDVMLFQLSQFDMKPFYQGLPLMLLLKPEAVHAAGKRLFKKIFVSQPKINATEIICDLYKAYNFNYPLQSDTKNAQMYQVEMNHLALTLGLDKLYKWPIKGSTRYNDGMCTISYMKPYWSLNMETKLYEWRDYEEFFEYDVENDMVGALESAMPHMVEKVGKAMDKDYKISSAKIILAAIKLITTIVPARLTYRSTSWYPSSYIEGLYWTRGFLHCYWLEALHWTMKIFHNDASILKFALSELEKYARMNDEYLDSMMFVEHLVMPLGGYDYHLFACGLPESIMHQDHTYVLEYILYAHDVSIGEMKRIKIMNPFDKRKLFFEPSDKHPIWGSLLFHNCPSGVHGRSDHSRFFLAWKRFLKEISGPIEKMWNKHHYEILKKFEKDKTKGHYLNIYLDYARKYLNDQYVPVICDIKEKISEWDAFAEKNRKAEVLKM